MTSGSPAASAVIVPIPEAEPVVRRHRVRHDRSAAAGVPAHVTVLYPFVPPGAIDQATLDELAAAVRTVPRFDCVFAEVRWFGEHLVWLAPDPDLPFRALTAAVTARFPEYPPYGDQYDDPAPHLTVGDGHLADLDTLRRTAAEVAAGLPVRAAVNRVRLMAGSDAPDSWHTLAEFTLPTG